MERPGIAARLALGGGGAPTESGAESVYQSTSISPTPIRREINPITISLEAEPLHSAFMSKVSVSLPSSSSSSSSIVSVEEAEREPAKEEIEEGTDRLAPFSVQKSHVTDNKCIFEETYTLEEGLVRRFGIYPQHVGAAAGYPILKRRLHLVEYELFQLALRALVSCPSAAHLCERPDEEASDLDWPNNAVIVDIFARGSREIEEGGVEEYIKRNKKCVDSEEPEVHSIVLWKKRDDQVVIIDPSRTIYSKHIAEAFSEEPLSGMLSSAGSSTLRVVVANIRGQVIYGPGEEQTGYSTYEEKHPRPRDCIDIAAKICIEINRQQRFIHKSNALENLEKATFTNLTNQEVLNKKLPKGLKGTKIRELQSTNSDDQAGAWQYLERYKKPIAELTAARKIKRIKEEKGGAITSETSEVADIRGEISEARPKLKHEIKDLSLTAIKQKLRISD